MGKREFSGFLKVLGAVLFMIAGVSYAMWFYSDETVTVYSRDGTVPERAVPTEVPVTASAEVSQANDSDGASELIGKPIPTETAEDKPVDINNADIDELKTLPGIGDAKAAAIIAYREANGGFKSIEDIMLVPGIKEGVFGKIKDHICVSSDITGNIREE